jgi:hypothetical protein
MEKNFFDPCPLNDNPINDGLLIEWGEKNFVNPPYSDVERWVDKAIREYDQGKNIILLLAARTDTKWFHKLLRKNPMIYFFKGRLSFNDKGKAPFPSILVYLINKKSPLF